MSFTTYFLRELSVLSPLRLPPPWELRDEQGMPLCRYLPPEPLTAPTGTWVNVGNAKWAYPHTAVFAQMLPQLPIRLRQIADLREDRRRIEQEMQDQRLPRPQLRWSLDVARVAPKIVGADRSTTEAIIQTLPPELRQFIGGVDLEGWVATPEGWFKWFPGKKYPETKRDELMWGRGAYPEQWLKNFMSHCPRQEWNPVPAHSGTIGED